MEREWVVSVARLGQSSLSSSSRSTPPGRTRARGQSPDTGAVQAVMTDPYRGADAEIHPGRTRLFLTPTARPLGAGQGYVAVSELFFPSVGVGVTDYLLLAGGISLGAGGGQAIHHVRAEDHRRTATDDFAAAAGFLYVGRTDGDGTGIIYADMTIGEIDRSATLGLGWGIRVPRPPGRPMVLAGFQVPLGGGMELVSENWFPPNLDPLLASLGTRVFSGPVSAEFAVWLPLGADDSGVPAFVPWVSFTFGF